MSTIVSLEYSTHTTGHIEDDLTAKQLQLASKNAANMAKRTSGGVSVTEKKNANNIVHSRVKRAEKRRM